MTRNWCAWIALVGCLTTSLVGSVASAAENDQLAFFVNDEKASESTEQAVALGDLSGDVELTSFGEAIGGLATGGCKPQFFVGGEYLYVRSTFSEAISYVTQDNTVAPLAGITFNEFDFDYNTSYRFYGGVRLPDCDYECRFTYTHFESDASFQSPTVDGTSTLQFFAPLEVVADVPGTSLSGSASVELDSYDLACSKTIPLGSPLCCDTGCGDTCGCGDACGCDCFCPAWDLTFTGGVRIADVDHTFAYANSIPTNTALQTGAQARTTFTGAGLRGGVMGRRYFGKSGIMSVFLKGDLSLLLGDLDVNVTPTAGSSFAPHRMSHTQIVPVTDIEAGLTAQLTQRVSVTGGYLFSAWHDMGYRVQYPFSTQPTGVQLEAFDDANILGFDGFFARVEAAF